MNDEKNRKDTKVNRILHIYDCFRNGEIVNKSKLASLFGVNEKSIQRDLDDIRSYLENNIDILGNSSIEYDRKNRGYILKRNDTEIINRADILALTKILLESRAFCKEELEHLISTLLGQVDKKQSQYIKEIIGNERFNYVPLRHNKKLLSTLWQLSEFISFKKSISIRYIKADGCEVERIINPVGIIFSEYYFYLIADIEKSKYDMPAVFRIDRIVEYKDTGKRFKVSTADRFEDGEYRKRVQFMYPGELMRVKFEYSGKSIDAILERLPTSKIIDEYEDKHLIEAEVYGKGIMMWILSQGSKIKVIEPENFINELIAEINAIRRLY